MSFQGFACLHFPPLHPWDYRRTPLSLPFSALGSGDWAKVLMLVSALLMNNISPAPFSKPLKAPASSLGSLFPGQWLCSYKEWYKTVPSWEQVLGFSGIKTTVLKRKLTLIEIWASWCVGLQTNWGFAPKTFIECFILTGYQSFCTFPNPLGRKRKSRVKRESRGTKFSWLQ